MSKRSTPRKRGVTSSPQCGYPLSEVRRSTVAGFKLRPTGNPIIMRFSSTVFHVKLFPGFCFDGAVAATPTTHGNTAVPSRTGALGMNFEQKVGRRSDQCPKNEAVTDIRVGAASIPHSFHPRRSISTLHQIRGSIRDLHRPLGLYSSPPSSPSPASASASPESPADAASSSSSFCLT